MGAGTAAAAEQCDAPGAIEQVSQCGELRLGRPHDRRRRQQPDIGRNAAPGRRTQRHIAGNYDNGDAAPPDRHADGVFQHVRQLRGVGEQFAIMAAFPKQFLRMGLLEVTAPDLAGRNLRGDRQHRRAAAVGVEQSVDEMQIAWTA